MLSVHSGCSRRMKRADSESTDEEIIHSSHKGQIFSNVTNAEIGIKAFLAVKRYIKCSKVSSVSWKTPESDRIKQTVG